MGKWWQDFFFELPEMDMEVFSRNLYMIYEKMRQLDNKED